MGEQEKQIYHLMGEIRSNVAEVRDLAGAVHETNRKIGCPQLREKKEKEGAEDAKEQVDPISITDHLVALRNNSQEAAKLLRNAVEDLNTMV